jgi:glycoprotein endo-alpha-1,2-mannosidase
MRAKSLLVRTHTDQVSAPRKSVIPQQIVSFFLAMFVGAAPIATSVKSAALVTVARLEVRITTTSPMTQVILRPGRIAAQREVSVPDDVKVTQLPAGWVLNTTGGQLRTVVMNAVFEETTRASKIQVAVRKGFAGRTDVDIRNVSGASFAAARVVNDLPRSATGAMSSDGLTVVLTRTRAQLLGSANPTAMRPVDTQRLVLAAYYPWYPGTEGRYANPQFADRPVDGRSTATWAGVLSMTQQARQVGVDGFIVSWEGEGYSGKSFDLALTAARQTGGVVSPYLEMLRAQAPGDTSGKASPLVVLEWLSAVLERADNPAFLRSGGIPVVFVWQMGNLSRLGWLNVLGELAKQGKDVRLVGDADNSYGAVQWGVQEYNPNFMTPADLARHNRDVMLDTRLLATSDAMAPHLYVATVSPGYDDSKIPDPARTAPVVPRGEAGERYLASWEAALAAQPDWVMITSWNEWFEGTAIEPSIGHRDLALRQTAEQAARFAE